MTSKRVQKKNRKSLISIKTNFGQRFVSFDKQWLIYNSNHRFLSVVRVKKIFVPIGNYCSENNKLFKFWNNKLLFSFLFHISEVTPTLSLNVNQLVNIPYQYCGYWTFRMEQLVIDLLSEKRDRRNIK